MSENEVEHLTLCRLSAIAISKHLWRNSSLKDHVKAWLDGDALTWQEMTPAIETVLDNFFIPDAAREELKLSVGKMGWEMGSMFDIMAHSNDDSLDLLTTNASACIDYVSWTIVGGVDEVTTMRSLYFAGILQNNCRTWMNLAELCLEDCLNDLWPKLRNQDRNSLRMLVNRKVTTILSGYWMSRLKCATEVEINQFRMLLDRFYDDTCSLDENMFIYFFLNNRYFMVKHFWELLDENQRVRIIAKVCEKIDSDDSNTRKYHKLLFSKSNKIDTDLLVFFLRQLSHHGHDFMRIRILGSGFTLAKLLGWPYDNSFMKTLRESLLYHDSINFGPIMSSVIYTVDVKYHRIFYEIWSMNPKNLKNSINYRYDLKLLWDLGNIELLNHILRDYELKDRRNHLLKELARRCRPAKANPCFLFKFIKQVLISGQELEWFIREYGCLCGKKK